MMKPPQRHAEADDGLVLCVRPTKPGTLRRVAYIPWRPIVFGQTEPDWHPGDIETRKP